MEFKPRLVIVGEPELTRLLAHQDDLGVPRVYKEIRSGFYVADPDDMRAWRSQSTSGAANGDR
jgi:hypothetical protein